MCYLWRIVLPILGLICSTVLNAFLFTKTDVDLQWINVGITLFIILKIMLVNRMVYAHGVDGKAKLFGMPLPLLIFYLLILVISLYIGIGLNDHIGLFHALRLLSPSIIIGWVAGLLDWYLFSSRETYYYSEATERANMTAEGINEGDIETIIQFYRDCGLFDPDK